MAMAADTTSETDTLELLTNAVRGHQSFMSDKAIAEFVSGRDVSEHHKQIIGIVAAHFPGFPPDEVRAMSMLECLI